MGFKEENKTIGPKIRMIISIMPQKPRKNFM
jgi:hypothetical protein